MNGVFMMHDWRPGDRFETILDQSIDELQAQPIERVLQKHPASAARLAPLLNIASALQQLSQAELSDKAKQKQRDRLRQTVLAKQRRHRSGRIIPRMMRATAWVAVVLVLLGAGVTALSGTFARSLPDDPFYRWKNVSERVWLNLQSGAGNQAAVTLSHADRRVVEIEQLVERAGEPDAAALHQLVEQLRESYQQTLALTAQAPADEQAQLRDETRLRAAAHERLFTKLAEQAEGYQQELLQAAAQSSIWAQSASGSPAPLPPLPSSPAP